MVDTTHFRWDWQAVALWLVAAPLYGLGWLVGVLVRCLLWLWAAIVAGYKAGKG